MSDTSTIDRAEVLKVFADQGAAAASELAGVSRRTIQRWAAVEGIRSGYTAPIIRECPSAAAYARGCDCDGCKEANREQQRQVKARRVAYFQEHGTKRDGTPIPHGVSGYSNWDCRCEVCRPAWSAYLREHRG
jgi:hypothetical protein